VNKGTEMNNEVKIIALALVFVALWAVFLFTGPAMLTSIAAFGVAGWQIGTWSAYLARKMLS